MADPRELSVTFLLEHFMAKKLIKNIDEASREEAAKLVLHHERKSLSDIVPAQKHNVISFVEEEEKKKSSVRFEETKERADESREDMENDESSGGISAIFTSHVGLWFFHKKWIALGAALIFLVLGGYVALAVLPRADLKINLIHKPWQFSGDISAMISGGDISAERITPSLKDSYLQVPLIATRKRNVQIKATGTIKIYNAYSSEAQTLVATTRFISPQGQMFRLDKGVIVPGAKIANGKITPSSIEVGVSADKAGPDYNVAAADRWTIPGLKGSPKYDGFYGVSDQPMTGGASGEQNYPSDEDIAAAKKNAEQAVRSAISALFAIGLSSDLTVLEGSSNFKILKSGPVSLGDGKYAYGIQAREDRLAVKKADIINLMSQRAAAELGSDFLEKSSDAKFDFKSSVVGKDGTLQGATLSVVFSADFASVINLDDMRSKVLGKSEKDLKALILSPGIEKIQIALWPFWVKTVPTSAGKVTISAE